MRPWATKPTLRHRTWQQTSHNPEVAGSNPAPATGKAPETGPFLCKPFRNPLDLRRDPSHHGRIEMRRELPTGTVTFLFTDIEGSTKLLDELGASAYEEARAEHRRVLREA